MPELRRKYQLSGSIGSSFILVPLSGVLATFLCGIAYAHVLKKAPVEWYYLLLALIYAIGIGAIVMAATITSKCRNTWVAGGLAFAVGLFAAYNTWVATLMAGAFAGDVSISEINFIWLYSSPIEVIQMFAMIVNSGASPIMDWIMLTVEFLIIVLGVTFMGVLALSDRVFCEQCHRWVGKVATLNLRFPGEEIELDRIVDGDFDTLCSLEIVSEKQIPRLIVEVLNCDQCNEISTYRILTATRKSDDEDKDGSLTTFLAGQFQVTKEEYDRLVSRIESDDRIGIEA